MIIATVTGTASLGSFSCAFLSPPRAPSRVEAGVGRATPVRAHDDHGDRHRLCDPDWSPMKRCPASRSSPTRCFVVRHTLWAAALVEPTRRGIVGDAGRALLIGRVGGVHARARNTFTHQKYRLERVASRLRAGRDRIVAILIGARSASWRSLRARLADSRVDDLRISRHGPDQAIE